MTPPTTHHERVSALVNQILSLGELYQGDYPERIRKVIVEQFPEPPEPTGQTVRQAIESHIDLYRDTGSLHDRDACIRHALWRLQEDLSARGLADLGVTQWVTGEQVKEAGMYWHVGPYLGMLPRLEVVGLYGDGWQTTDGRVLKPGDGWWQRCLAPAPPTAGVHKERCPKCGSHRVAVSKHDEVMVCYDCGQWFQSKHVSPVPLVPPQETPDGE